MGQRFIANKHDVFFNIQDMQKNRLSQEDVYWGMLRVLSLLAEFAHESQLMWTTLATPSGLTCIIHPYLSQLVSFTSCGDQAVA